jgi:nucleotide-binding universal stress UspA family protein
MFDKILLLTDLSDTTRLAFQPVARIAQAFSAKVTLFHAYRGSSELFYLDGEAKKLLGLIDDADKKRVLPKLEEFKAELAALDCYVEVVTRVGSTFELAVDYTRESGADLVVLATQGLHEFTGRVLGSATARILRDTDVPVLTVNERFAERADAWGGFQKIVHPVDFAVDWHGGLRAAEEFAVEVGGRVEVVHVVEPAQAQTMTTMDGEILLPKDLHYQIRTKLQARLSDAAHEVTRVPAFWHLIEDNKPGSGVMSYADRQGTDLIVVPMLERDATRTTVLGSVVEHLIKHARCPVLTIKHGWSVKAKTD